MNWIYWCQLHMQKLKFNNKNNENELDLLVSIAHAKIKI